MAIIAHELPTHDEHLPRVTSAVLVAFALALVAVLLSPAPVSDALDVARHVLGHVQHRRVITLEPPPRSPSRSRRVVARVDEDDPVPNDDPIDDAPPDSASPARSHAQAMTAVLTRVLASRDVDLGTLAFATADAPSLHVDDGSHADDDLVDVRVGAGALTDVEVERRLGPAPPPPQAPPERFICVYPAHDKPSLVQALKPAVLHCAHERLWGDVYVENGVARVNVRVGDKSAAACIEAELRHRTFNIDAELTAPFIYEPEPSAVVDKPPPLPTL